MIRRVLFSPEANADLDELYDYIADAATPGIAAAYIEAIITYCEQLADFPHRGRARDDIRPGIRTIGYRRRAVVAFSVGEDAITILGIYYGGRDYERILDQEN